MKLIRDILEPLFICGLITIIIIVTFIGVFLLSFALVHCLQLICDYLTHSSTEHILPPDTYL